MFSFMFVVVLSTFAIYYTSKRLLEAEQRYPEMEKLALALIVSSRKLRHYFLAHPIEVLTNFPLKKIVRRPEASGQLAKWSIELTQYDLSFKPRTAIRGQVLADFVAEFTKPLSAAPIEVQIPRWKLYVDGSSNENGAGAGVIHESPEGLKFSSALRFSFRASNNEAEYEALIAGVRLARELKAEAISVYSDSKLVVGQITWEFVPRDERMVRYLTKAKDELEKFVVFEVIHVLRGDNVNADALAKLATSRDSELLKIIPVGTIAAPSITEEAVMMEIGDGETWMSEILEYLVHDRLPTDPNHARRVKYQAEKYLIYDEKLYKRGISTPLLRCLNDSEANEVLKEIHEGTCGNQAGGQSLAVKALRQGYFWPTMNRDAKN